MGEACGHDVQWHPLSEDFGVCSKCGARMLGCGETLLNLDAVRGKLDEMAGRTGMGAWYAEAVREMREWVDQLAEAIEREAV